MRSAERELIEADKKRQVAADSVQTAETSKARAVSAVGDASKSRMAELTTQIEAEAKRLAVIRMELQKTRNLTVVDRSVVDEATASSVAALGSAVKAAQGKLQPSRALSLPKEKEDKDKLTQSTGARGVPSKPVPDGILPDLCRYVSC